MPVAPDKMRKTLTLPKELVARVRAFPVPRASTIRSPMLMQRCSSWR